MSYINAAPGTASAVTLILKSNSVSGNLTVPALQDLTINNANDIFTWTQLDGTSKYNVPTTATNSLATNIVVDELTFFGNTSATANSANYLGVFGLSNAKTACTFYVNFGSKTISGTAYVSGLAPKITADAPVWVTPVTLTVSGSYTVA
jgi:hypothetical protein